MSSPELMVLSFVGGVFATLAVVWLMNESYARENKRIDELEKKHQQDEDGFLRRIMDLKPKSDA